MASVLYNTRAFCNFSVLADNVSDFKKRQVEALKDKFKHFDITWIDLDDKNREYITKTFISKSKTNMYTKNIANYSRFLMPDLLPNVKRSIYLDSDILVYGDIAELYNYDLGKFILGAVADSYVLSDKSVNEQVSRYISHKHLYFNAGILLIDCDKWRKQKIFTKIAQSDAKICDKKLFNSQDPLNKYFECNYKTLPHKFNWFSSYPDEAGIIHDIVIRHFTGTKPDVNPRIYDIATISNFYFFANFTPFAEEVKLVATPVTTSKAPIRKIKLFGFIPFLKIKKDKIYLFGFIKLFKVTR